MKITPSSRMRRPVSRTRQPTLPPVLVLSTGRCGSTMLSNILNQHPRVLSLSEFFSYVGVQSLYRRRRPDGDAMWRMYSGQQKHTRMMLRDPSFGEFLYPAGDPGARFTVDDVPSILCATLPHITKDYESLFDQLEPVIRGQPRQPPGAHLNHLFGWLCERFGAHAWAERSGASILFAPKLLREFPDARVVHIFRDGRETALSMRGHYLFRLIVATLNRVRKTSIDPFFLMRRKRLWERASAWMEILLPVLVQPGNLSLDELTNADFAALWSEMILLEAKIRMDIPEERYLAVRFETLQTEPRDQLRRLIRFIDPSLEDEEWLREAAAIPRPTPSRFARLGAREQAAITAACRPGLEMLGYGI